MLTHLVEEEVAEVSAIGAEGADQDRLEGVAQRHTLTLHLMNRQRGEGLVNTQREGRGERRTLRIVRGSLNV